MFIFFPNEAKIKSLFFSGMSLGRRSSNEREHLKSIDKIT